MEKRNQTIFSKDWLAFHPYQNAASSDLYYVLLANKVYCQIESHLTSTQEIQLSKGELIQFSCILTAYFEDVISQTGIFKTFTRECQKRTGRPLPFFNTPDYEADEINIEDLQLLTWHYLVQMQGEGAPYPPTLPIIKAIADCAMKLFDEAYETAPENEKLKSFLSLDQKNYTLDDLYNRFFWLGIESYLFFANGMELQHTIEEVVLQARENNDEIDVPAFINIVCRDFAYNLQSEWFGCQPAQYLAMILGENHPAYSGLQTLSKKYKGYFSYVDEDKNSIRIQHLATEKLFEINKKSLVGFPKELKENNCIVHMGIVNWENQWYSVDSINGYESTDDILNRIKASEDEINLFNDQWGTPSDEDQQTWLQTKLEELHAITDAGEKQNYGWDLLSMSELKGKTIKQAFEQNKLPGTIFWPECNDSQDLIKNNLEFMLYYFKGEC